MLKAHCGATPLLRCVQFGLDHGIPVTCGNTLGGGGAQRPQMHAGSGSSVVGTVPTAGAPLLSPSIQVSLSLWRGQDGYPGLRAECGLWVQLPATSWLCPAWLCPARGSARPGMCALGILVHSRGQEPWGSAAPCPTLCSHCRRHLVLPLGTFLENMGSVWRQLGGHSREWGAIGTLWVEVTGAEDSPH